MTLGISRKHLIALLVAVFCTTTLWAGQWAVMGPDGGDVRSLSYDPHNPDHIFLGTNTGTMFESTDGGHNWARFARLGGDDYVLDHIAIDPKNHNIMYVAAWSVENQQAGDLFRTHDGGKNWEPLSGMHGKSIRAFAIAAADSQVLAAGALDGVYRSTDGGNSWERISPSGHAEIKNIESIAIDPKNPNVVYAGTWHLAWKTDDAGANWHHINKGMIDDSDVFSVIVDSANPSVVFASACSGIYKSETAGESFSKIQGIPFSARRTRVLKQDPGNENIVYAGTTEGLWKTSDLGKTWKRVTSPDVVVNDVMVDPRNSQHVLLATDRSGVLASDNGTASWDPSNHGYAHRYVSSIVVDKGTMFVGVVNDKEQGGVFASHDGGKHWLQNSSGLGGRDVFTLKQTENGALVAGTNRGVFTLPRNASQWISINVVANEASYRTVKKGTKTIKIPVKSASPSILEARVNDVEVDGKQWIAATSAGLFTSKNEGKSWTGGPVMGKSDFVAVDSNGELMIAATRTNVVFSKNAGKEWQAASLPGWLTSIHSVTITPDEQMLVASREGAFRSGDSGASWQHMMDGLPDKNITSISFDEAGKRLLATSNATGVIFQSKDGGRRWVKGPDAGYPLRRVSVVRGRFVGATPFDGVIAQPEHESDSASDNGSN